MFGRSTRSRANHFAAKTNIRKSIKTQHHMSTAAEGRNKERQQRLPRAQCQQIVEAREGSRRSALDWGASKDLCARPMNNPLCEERGNERSILIAIRVLPRLGIHVSFPNVYLAECLPKSLPGDFAHEKQFAWWLVQLYNSALECRTTGG